MEMPHGSNNMARRYFTARGVSRQHGRHVRHVNTRVSTASPQTAAYTVGGGLSSDSIQGLCKQEAVKLGQSCEVDVVLDQRLHWKRFDCSVLLRRGGCFQTPKIILEGLFQQQLHLIPGQDGLMEGGEVTKRSWASKNDMRDVGKPWYTSRLINEEAARWINRKSRRKLQLSPVLWSFAPVRNQAMLRLSQWLTPALIGRKHRGGGFVLLAGELSCHSHTRKEGVIYTQSL